MTATLPTAADVAAGDETRAVELAGPLRSASARFGAAADRVAATWSGVLGSLTVSVALDVAVMPAIGAGWAQVPAAVPLLPLVIGAVRSRRDGGAQ